ncbi:uncharacterized protein N7525_000677 [Penicillium rubens]|uniref:uncharacterized protein n=1 Tax=Penicillium rubens TaxID=1108849 RepID=UPI002A59F6C6|nr:uncharacterized protein N7525_000677 [Penicillium rubens]KAJ5842936.1 hypothetical protein N7525_000677 [Penicillium rubens]
MKNFIALAAFAAGSNALVGRRDTCCFQLSSSGGASGTLGQLGDGQNRIGDDSLQPAQYCIDDNGAITDSNGRGCILTPPTTQLQCDEGVAPAPGFSINSEGGLEYNNSPDFVACATGQNGASVPGPQPTAPGGGGGGGPQPSPSMPAPSGGAGVPPSVTEPAPGGGGGTQPGASASIPPPGGGGGGVSVPPHTGGGGSATVPTPTGSPTGVRPHPTGGFGNTSVPVSPTSPATATGTSGGACPTTLTGNYEIPHLIVRVDSSSPDTSAGTGLNGTVTSTISTVFNFDIPNSDAGKTCSLVFLFPRLEDLETSSYTFSGDGKIDFAKLSSTAVDSTSFSNVPSVSQDLGTITASPGNSYVISTFSCPAGQAVTYQMKNAGSTDFNFFEDWNPSPLGLFITTC